MAAMGHSLRFDAPPVTSGLSRTETSTPGKCQEPTLEPWMHEVLNDSVQVHRIEGSASSQRASIFLRWSFGQPSLPQSFFVSQKVFGPPKRAQHAFESGNT